MNFLQIYNEVHDDSLAIHLLQNLIIHNILHNIVLDLQRTKQSVAL